jgi:peptide/nickel transport system substrate-binding protein
VRSPKAFAKLLTAVGAIAAIAACTGTDTPKKAGGGGEKGTGEAAATGIGTPNPPFQGDLPKGALKVNDFEVGKYGGTLVLATAGDPKSFNPVLANETSTTDITNGPVFATCWDFDNGKQEERPGLCESYERSDDGLTYTFHLREGLRWSDGQPLDADDFEFTYAVVIDPNVPTTQKDLFRQGKDAAGKEQFPDFEKVDARTFRFKLKKKDILFHFNVGSLYVVPKHKWEADWKAGKFPQTMTLQTPPDDIVSSGPYRIKSYAASERVVLERNPYYWKVDQAGNRLPYLDRVIFAIVPDFNVEFLKFREGETDVLDVRPEHYDLLKREEQKGDYTVVDLGASMNTNYLMFNLSDGKDKDGKPVVDPAKLKWFQNKNFRKAISHAIDRDGIVRTVFHGRAQPLWTFVSPANKKWYPAKFEQYPYDLEKSKALLAAEGFTKKDDGLYDADGHKVEFSIMTNSENATRIALINVLKDDLEKLGITINVRPVPFNDVVTAMQDAHNFEGLVLGWASGVPPDPELMKNILLSSGRSHNWNPNQVKPATPWEGKMDELLLQSNELFDYGERKKLIDEIYYIFSDEQPQIQLVVANAYAAGRNYVGNFKPSTLRPVTHWNIESMYLKHPKKS